MTWQSTDVILTLRCIRLHYCNRLSTCCIAEQLITVNYFDFMFCGYVLLRVLHGSRLQ